MQWRKKELVDWGKCKKHFSLSDESFESFLNYFANIWVFCHFVEGKSEKARTLMDVCVYWWRWLGIRGDSNTQVNRFNISQSQSIKDYFMKEYIVTQLIKNYFPNNCGKTMFRNFFTHFIDERFFWSLKMCNLEKETRQPSLK